MAKHAAILIHGIGQEQRYEIMDDFVQGLNLLGVVRKVDVVFPRVQHGDANLVAHAKRVTFDDPARPALDVFEVYWAPLTKGRTTLNSLLGWFMLNTFIPGRMLHFPGAKNRFVTGYVLSVLGLVAIAVGALIYELYATGARLPLGLMDKGVVAALGTLGWWRILLTFLGTYLAFQAAYRIGELYKDWRGPNTPGISGRDRVREALVDARLLLFSLGGFFLFRALVRTPFYDFALVYTGYRLVALWLRNYFVNYAGDIQVYVTRDENNGRYAARVAVLSQAVEVITNVLRSRENYERVTLLGHSLGSVIGLDVIRELATRVRAGQLPQGAFGRLVAFVTYGSPLEKTLFFFGRGAPRDDGGIDNFQQHVQAAMTVGRGIEWYNAWYSRDIVADPLTSYGTVTDWPLQSLNSRSRLFLRWVHSDYLSDEAFLRLVWPLL
jgi:hypothetical protein